MTNKEREKIKNEIAYRDVMTRKVGKSSKYCLLAFLFTGAIAVWGFTGFADPFFQVSDSIRNVLKWIGLVIAIPTGALALLFYVSYHNSKKRVMKLIDELKTK